MPKSITFLSGYLAGDRQGNSKAILKGQLIEKKIQILLWPGASSGEFTTTECGVNHQLLIDENILKQPNGELLVEVDHNQLWTMASETVVPI